MQIHTAVRGHIQHHLGQEQAIGGHYHQIRCKGGQFGLSFGIAQTERLKHRNASLQCRLFDRAGGQFSPATCRAIRLGINRHHVFASVQQGT